MRAIWKGAVSFGLVNVPVRLYSATENHDVSFRQVHREDGGRIKYQRICSIDGQQVSYDDIAKGYETEDGDMVVLTDEDFKDLPATSSKEIAVQKFVPAEQIDPMLLDKSYYLEPDKSATKPYILLRDALGQADRMAVVTVSIRTRMTMAVLRVKDGVIVMQTMLWPDEVRAADFASLDEDSHATGKELEMANMLIESLAGDYDPERVRGRLRPGGRGPREGQARGWRGAAGAREQGRDRRGRGSACRAGEVGREGEGRQGRGPRRGDCCGHEVRADEGPGKESGRQEDDHQEGCREEDRGEGQLRYAGLAGRPRPPGRG